MVVSAPHNDGNLHKRVYAQPHRRLAIASCTAEHSKGSLDKQYTRSILKHHTRAESFRQPLDARYKVAHAVVDWLRRITERHVLALGSGPRVIGIFSGCVHARRRTRAPSTNYQLLRLWEIRKSKYVPCGMTSSVEKTANITY